MEVVGQSSRRSMSREQPDVIVLSSDDEDASRASPPVHKPSKPRHTYGQRPNKPTQSSVISIKSSGPSQINDEIHKLAPLASLPGTIESRDPDGLFDSTTDPRTGERSLTGEAQTSFEIPRSNSTSPTSIDSASPHATDGPSKTALIDDWCSYRQVGEEDPTRSSRISHGEEGLDVYDSGSSTEADSDDLEEGIREETYEEVDPEEEYEEEDLEEDEEDDAEDCELETEEDFEALMQKRVDSVHKLCNTWQNIIQRHSGPVASASSSSAVAKGCNSLRNGTEKDDDLNSFLAAEAERRRKELLEPMRKKMKRRKGRPRLDAPPFKSWAYSTGIDDEDDDDVIDFGKPDWEDKCHSLDMHRYVIRKARHKGKVFFPSREPEAVELRRSPSPLPSETDPDLTEDDDILAYESIPGSRKPQQIDHPAKVMATLGETSASQASSSRLVSKPVPIPLATPGHKTPSHLLGFYKSILRPAKRQRLQSSSILGSSPSMRRLRHAPMLVPGRNNLPSQPISSERRVGSVEVSCKHCGNYRGPHPIRKDIEKWVCESQACSLPPSPPPSISSSSLSPNSRAVHSSSALRMSNLQPALPNSKVTAIHRNRMRRRKLPKGTLDRLASNLEEEDQGSTEDSRPPTPSRPRPDLSVVEAPVISSIVPEVEPASITVEFESVDQDFDCEPSQELSNVSPDHPVMETEDQVINLPLSSSINRVSETLEGVIPEGIMPQERPQHSLEKKVKQLQRPSPPPPRSPSVKSAGKLTPSSRREKMPSSPSCGGAGMCNKSICLTCCGFRTNSSRLARWR